MQTGTRLPDLLVGMFVSSREAWVIDTRVPPDDAQETFHRVMDGRAATGLTKVSQKVAGGNLKWHVSGDTATCVGGRPARIPRYKASTQKFPPDGQQLAFANTNSQGARHQYQLIPAQVTMIPFLAIFSLNLFSKQFRYYYRRVIADLRVQDPALEVDYPISIAKVLGWVTLLILVLWAVVS